MSDSRPPLLITIIGAIALLATVAVAFALRLADPLSTSVIPAEDPYNHMALIREHMRSGTLTALDAGSALYPPGMHALLAAIWAYTGASLYEIIRLGPVFFGALGVLGMGLLLWRHVGPIGAFVGSLGYAVVPEVVFRTAMMSPTAIDLALVPFFLYAVLELAAGRLRWMIPAGLIALFFVFAHPWLLGILVISSVFFVLVTWLFPGSQQHASRTSIRGLAALIAVTGGSLGLAMTGCGGYCGPGLSNFLPDVLNQPWAAGLVLGISLAIGLLVAAYPRSLDRFLIPSPRRPLSMWIKLPISALIAALILVVTLPAVAQGMPEQVDLPRMIGWPILMIAGFGLVALPFIASRISYLGTGVILATYPMVIYNVFNSPFWPHRTVVFFAFGAAILLGITAAAVTRWTVVAFASLQDTLQSRLKNTTLSRKKSGLSTFVVVPALLIVASLSGTVYTETPDIYEGGWYRMYPECEMDAMQEMADKLNEDPNALMVTGSWQARLVVGSMTDDPSRVWFDPRFMTNYDRREDTLAIQARDGGPVHLVIDRHLEDEITRGDLGFLHEPPWQKYNEWCAGMGLEQSRIEMHTTGGPPV